MRSWYLKQIIERDTFGNRSVWFLKCDEEGNNDDDKVINNDLNLNLEFVLCFARSN